MTARKKKSIEEENNIQEKIIIYWKVYIPQSKKSNKIALNEYKAKLLGMMDKKETKLFLEEDALLREEEGSTRYEIKRRRVGKIQKDLTELQDELDSINADKS